MLRFCQKTNGFPLIPIQRTDYVAKKSRFFICFLKINRKKNHYIKKNPIKIFKYK